MRTRRVHAAALLCPLLLSGACEWERTPAPSPETTLSPSPPDGRFPLSVPPGARYVVDASGRPFLLHGEAAWSLITQLTLEDAELYMADRQRRGVQVLMINLINHEFSLDPPRNAYGEDPFVEAGQLDEPNEAYFAHADRVLGMAQAHGMAVILYPAYAGFLGGSQGWWEEMSALDEDECRAYGDYLGQRYAGQQNIIWASGGDYFLPVGEDGERCALAIRAAIAERDPDALHTGHWARESTSLDHPSFAASIDLDGIYTDLLTHRLVRRAWLETDKPLFLLEARYENELGTLPEWRAQYWWAMLSGARGQIVGNHPIWPFADGWREALDSPLSRQMDALRRTFDGWDWWRLAPDVDGSWLVAGAGDPEGADWASAALSVNRGLGVVYLPPASARDRTVTLDLGRLRGAARATWVDPTTGAALEAGVLDAGGQHRFTAPGPNAEGASDWVLVLKVE